jgi:hypothetical protein
VEPYTDEIIKCDQLVAMLQKYVPAQAAAASVTKSEFKVPEGVSILKKDRDAGMDSWFSGLGGGSKKGKGKGAPKDKSGEKLSLSLDGLASLQSISVTAPLTLGEVAGTIEKVKEKKVHYEGLQKEAKAKREAKAAAEKEGIVVDEEEKEKEGDKAEEKGSIEVDEEKTEAPTIGVEDFPAIQKESKKVEANGVKKSEEKEEEAEEVKEDAS